ncbi:unnamed protein product [Polarella glacialis]|uniref:ATP-dependent DNA helicase n=1 Tax=Polarella glacialis TaxID=89957 RepID=A0A813KTC4_POLGL|nr:unnamed protein product [Polarella glacialis]
MRAASLPEDGVPPEIVRLLPVDDTLDKIQVQKAATPVDLASDLTTVANRLSTQIPNAVVNELSSSAEADLNDQRTAALHAVTHELQGGIGDGTNEAAPVSRMLHQFEVRTGSELLDQTKPWYFGIAFAFVYKFCTGMPDPPQFADHLRIRRRPEAPRIELGPWMAVQARRVESQLKRDWLLGFTQFSWFFRSSLNLSPAVYALDGGKEKQVTVKDLEDAAVSLCAALHGSYIDTSGHPRPVNGDITKLRYVKSLSPIALRMLDNVEHISRRKDPVNLQDEHSREFGGRLEPPMGHDFGADEEFVVGVPMSTLAGRVPSYEERRRILARDPLAASDGFRLLMHLSFEFIFGVRVCPYCPDCNHVEYGTPCKDLFGSSSKSGGGSFGRVDDIDMSIEAQKTSGCLHGHAQVFVQCLHQHTPLLEIFERMQEGNAELLQEYLRYKQHVCRQTYARRDQWEARQEATEKAWPAYESSTALITVPAYLLSNAMAEPRHDSASESHDWVRHYLAEHVQRLQELKTKQLISKGVLLCQGLCKRMELVWTGRRSMLGSLHGPVNDAKLNGTHPALLASLACNSDVQLPYRFPIRRGMHSEECPEECWANMSEEDIVEAAQHAQDAQAGYACDYQNKRGPMAFNEIKEAMKGHRDLGGRLHDKEVHYIGGRHVKRFLTDVYGKGVVRGAVENVNLRSNYKEHDVTAAETIELSKTEMFSGGEFLSLIEQAVEQASVLENKLKIFGAMDRRHARHKKLSHKTVAIAYAYRPRRQDVWYLSPYEFAVFWEVRLLRYPLVLMDNKNSENHAFLTPVGEKKLRRATPGQSPALHAGIDYVVKEAGCTNWLPLQDCEATRACRHDWVLVRRRRPMIPSFAGSPLPKRGGEAQERNARIILTYFRPWTLDGAWDEWVAAARSLRSKETWQLSLRSWLESGYALSSCRKYVSNFCAVNRVRPADDDLLENSDDNFEDEELDLSSSDLAEALLTRVGGRLADPEQVAEGAAVGHHANSAAAMRYGEGVWPTHIAAEQPRHQEGGQVMPQQLLKEIWKAARQAPGSKAASSGAGCADTPPSVRQRKALTSSDVSLWFASVRARVDPHGRPVLNCSQQQALAKVVDRVIVEVDAISNPAIDAGEPLIWLIHGRPGAGKSHVVKFARELFEDVLQWTISQEYLMVALQAVMAEQLGGDTLHHALSIPCFGKFTGDEQGPSQKDLAARLLQCRWLIIDEISMVSARLLAAADMKLRDVIRRLHTCKATASGHDRSFGGLDVLLVGDFNQLDPPEGGSLAALPAEFLGSAREHMPSPTVAHGQRLMWGGESGCVQGVSELTENERLQDPWLREVQEEVRDGRLSVMSHAFLHGHRTDVCGSWTTKGPLCQQPKCISDSECDVCQKERAARCLVAMSEHDLRFHSDRFVSALAIFPNNDIKYDVDKRRAIHFAQCRNECITWCKAVDTPTSKALAERPNVGQRKLDWLSRHDRDCGNLYGMLPLVKGMPVALTEHLISQKDKTLLRGCLGFVQSWVLRPEEKSTFETGSRILTRMPQTVFVKFPHATWQIQGLAEPGLYPVRPRSSSWFLDKNRKNPVLQIRRLQLPLAPAFAMTAHSAQGQTLEAAIVDLQLGSDSSPQASYVALNRVRKKEDLVIFRPFERSIFTKGSPEGPKLLLQHLRGEAIDWAALEAKYMPKSSCAGCSSRKPKDAFTMQMWCREEFRYCKKCVQAFQASGNAYECSGCHVWRPASGFTSLQLEARACRRRCNACRDTAEVARLEGLEAAARTRVFTCCWCQQAKGKDDFSANQLDKSEKVCRACSHAFTCCQCKQAKGKDDFSANQLDKSEKTCRACSHAFTCCQCRQAKCKDDFSANQLDKSEKVCRACSHAFTCCQCKQAKGKDDFSANQLDKSEKTCRACSHAFTCCQCRQAKCKDDFSANQLDKSEKVCRACSHAFTCCQCKQAKGKDDFSANQLDKSEKTCRACSHAFTCCQCRQAKCKDDFSANQLDKSEKVCRACSHAFTCCQCKQAKGKDDFSANQLDKSEKTCRACSHAFTCCQCRQAKCKDDFSANQLDKSRKMCRACSHACTCCQCKQAKGKDDFSANQLDKSDKVCKSCQDLVNCTRCKEAKGRGEFGNQQLKKKDKVCCRCSAVLQEQGKQ